jgi:hypothetical protein
MSLRADISPLLLPPMLCAGLIVSGCAAVHTSIAKKDLDVQTKMSDTVFLEPVGHNKKIVFVQIRNTSDKALDIEGLIVNAITARGYRVTHDPDSAHFRLLGWEMC